MKVSSLANPMKIAGRVSNPTSLTPLFRSVELGVDTIRVCSEFGNVEMGMAASGLTSAVILETEGVNTVVQSLPSDGELILSQKDNKVNWKCGDARGHWMMVEQDEKIQDLTHQNYPWTPSPQFSKTLQLGTAACQAATVSIGMYGVVVGMSGKEVRFISSNSISLSESREPSTNYPGLTITLRPPIPAILSTLISSCPDCTLDVTNEGIFILGKWLAAHLPIAASLDFDLFALADKYQGNLHSYAIDSEAVKRFLARAKQLIDKHTDEVIGFSVKDGKLHLEQTGVAAASEETFLAQGMDSSVTFNSLNVPIELMMVPLAHATHVVLDHINDKVLIFTGNAPYFRYVVSGR